MAPSRKFLTYRYKTGGDQMSEHIRVGIVGASPQSWATAAHLPALAHLDELTVTAVATTRQDSARAAAGTFGIPHAFASAEELASHPEVDLVVGRQLLRAGEGMRDAER